MINKILWLIQPNDSLTNAEDRQRSQLLSSMLLVLASVGTFIIANVVYLSPNDLHDPRTIVGIIAIALSFVIYGINRMGYVRAASLGFVGFMTVLLLTPVYIDDSSNFLAFGAIPMLLAGMLFPFRWTTFVTGGIIAAVFVLNRVFPAEIWSRQMLWYFLCLSGALVLTFIRHLDQLENIRRRALEVINRKLRESEISLEHRVQERTRDMELAADVAKQIASVLSLEQLLPDVVEHTRQVFDLYHVSVYLYQDEQLVYAAGTGEAGHQMKLNNRSFAMNTEHRGIVLRAAILKQPTLVNDVSGSTDHVANPYLPQTRSELALPMKIGDQLIGVLDLQARDINSFNNDNVRVFTSLADQISVAVQNASLYAQQVKVAEELRAIDQLKSQFLASMSHELRTPLNAILNFTEFVSLGMLGPVNDNQRDALQNSLDSGRHLLTLINDVLDMTKIQSGMMNLFIEHDVNVKKELDTVSATAKTLLSDKPVNLVLDFDETLPAVTGDRRRIRQILLNLASNACKFTQEGTITISAKNFHDHILFAVADTGPGIASEDQDLIFQPFRQTEAGLQHAGGTGLGLPISKKLVEAHGGTIWLESSAGHGAIFYVSLPIHSEAALAKGA